jgi:hypothetical protein
MLFIFSMRCIATVRTRTTENTAPLLLAARVLRALPSSVSMCNNIVFINVVRQIHALNFNDPLLTNAMFTDKCKFYPALRQLLFIV